MKHFFPSLALALTLASTTALATNVGVSVTVGEPGFYGRIDVTNYPPPQLLYAQPVVIETVPVGVVRPPVYVYVPEKEAKHWRKNCKKYGICGQPVYFVRETWYRNVYVPEYRKHKGKHPKDKPDKHGKDKGR